MSDILKSTTFIHFLSIFHDFFFPSLYTLYNLLEGTFRNYTTCKKNLYF